MYKRIIVIVASALFCLLALLAVIITDLYDRDYPQDIGVKSSLILDFGESNFTITEAILRLEELDAHWNLGLIKVAPDLADDFDSQVFVSFNDPNVPSEFTWFSGDEVAKVVGKERLAHSYPDGIYHVTGGKKNLNELTNILESEGVKITRMDASIFKSLGFIIQEKGFAAAILASFALIVSLALFWLSQRARGRSLRVLSGCPTTRIQVQDLASFVSILLIAAGAVTLIATGYVGIFHGWMYVVTFLKVSLSLQITVILISLLASLIMSVSAWPSATMLATRQPAIKSLRSAAIVVQVITFLLVLAAAGPAWSAFKHSTAMAEEMGQWKKLADQVAIVFATDGDEMEKMERQIGELVKEAEALDKIALSYTWTKEMQMEVDFGGYSGVSFLNEGWLNLVMGDTSLSTITPVSYKTLPKELVQMIRDHFEIWSREEFTEETLAQFEYFQPVEGFKIPIGQGGGGGKLHFTDEVLIVVLPSLYDNYNDANLTSMISTGNIVFTGVSATQQLLKEHNLHLEGLRNNNMGGELNVVYIAEEGILLAQYAAYVVWLLNFSLIALVIAFTVAASISALISAMLQSKRDFPMRLAGWSWGHILQGRVMKELLVGIILILAVLLFQNPGALGATLVAGLYGIFIVPLCHLLATRWCFNKVSNRRL